MTADTKVEMHRNLVVKVMSKNLILQPMNSKNQREKSFTNG